MYNNFGVFIYSRKIQSLTLLESWSYFPVLIIFYATEYYFINRINPSLAPWISIILAAFILILYQWAKVRSPNRALASQSMILAFISIVFFHSIYLELLPLSVRPWLFVLIMLGLNLFPRKSFTAETKATYLIPILVLLIIVFIEYIDMIFNLINNSDISWLIVSLAAFISIWLLALNPASHKPKSSDFDYLILS